MSYVDYATSGAGRGGLRGRVVDFGALPPEVNSARMYAGAGSTSLTTAASAWSALCRRAEFGRVGLRERGHPAVQRGVAGAGLGVDGLSGDVRMWRG